MNFKLVLVTREARDINLIIALNINSLRLRVCGTMSSKDSISYLVIVLLILLHN